MSASCSFHFSVYFAGYSSTALMAGYQLGACTYTFNPLNNLMRWVQLLKPILHMWKRRYDLPKATSLKGPTQNSDPRTCVWLLPMLLPGATSFLKNSYYYIILDRYNRIYEEYAVLSTVIKPRPLNPQTQPRTRSYLNLAEFLNL